MLQTVIARVKGSEVVRGAAVLASGTAAAQVVMVAATPILTRLFSPEQYGILGFVASIAAVLAIAGTLSYDRALLLERDGDGASHLVVLVLAWSVLLSVIASVGGTVIGMVSSPAANAYRALPWAGLLTLVMAMNLTLSAWAVHLKHYRTIAVADLLSAIAIVTIQLITGLFDLEAAGLLGGQIAGTIVALLVLGTLACRSAAFASLWEFDLRTKLVVARKHYRFPLYATPAALLERSSKGLPVFLLAIFFSPVEAGYYWLCYRLIAYPVRLVVRSSRRPYYKQAVDMHARGESVAPLLWKSTGLFAAFAIAMVVGMILFAPPLFEVVFGEEWQRAGHYAQWIALATAASVVSVPCLELAPIFERQGQVLAFQIVQAIARVLALSIGGLLANDLLAIGLFAIVSCVMNIAVIGYFWLLVRSPLAVAATPTSVAQR
jgi:O-antigen/teichoic acid export membrane protein